MKYEKGEQQCGLYKSLKGDASWYILSCNDAAKHINYRAEFTHPIHTAC